MKAKKLFAVILTATLVVLPVSNAFAADQTTLNSLENNYEAVVNYVDPTQSIRMVLPTDESLKFTLDPQHLAATQGVGSWAPGDGGQILPASVVQIVNKSAVSVKTQVSFALTDSADQIVLQPDDTDINDGSDKNMNLTLTPADAETSITTDAVDEVTAPVFFKSGTDPVEFTVADLDAAGVTAGNRIALADATDATFGQFVAVDDPATKYNQVEFPVAAEYPATVATTVSQYIDDTNGFLSTTIVPVAEDGADLAFVMKKADYYVTKTAPNVYALKYDETTNTNYDVASYIIGGSINMNADWSDYTGSDPATLNLTATYTFSTMTNTDANAVFAVGGSKITGTYNSVPYVSPITPTAPSIAATTAEIAADTAEVVTVSLGAGNLAATGITSVSYNDGTDHNLVADTDYSFSGTDLTFKTAYVNSLIGAGNANVARTFTVTFNDGSTATTDTIELTYTAATVAAAVTPANVTFSKASGATVAVTLGSGSGLATGITSVATVTTSDVIWDASWYTFDAGTKVLTIKSTAGINALALASTRTIKVTFNTGATDTFIVTIAN